MIMGLKNEPHKNEVTDDSKMNSEVVNMATERIVIPGIVKNGMVVPQNDTPLPDGAHVDILMSPADVTPDLKSELD
jgi:hypothetical protein